MRAHTHTRVPTCTHAHTPDYIIEIQGREKHEKIVMNKKETSFAADIIANR